MRACDTNIRAKIGTTSCEFAQNVFYEFWNTSQASDDAVSAYSPVTGQTYDLDCRQGSSVTCRADDGAVVRFFMAGIDAYDSDQADAYCRSHDVRAGGDACAPDELALSATQNADEGAAAVREDCDPNYSGACLDPSSYDYDCEGGSGDGPDYTGTVEVIGDDPYELDRDGDGIACDS